MSTLGVLNTQGKKVGKVSLPEWSEENVSHTLVHQVATGILANQRRSTAHTKTRGEVRGGGKKPWRQKGTGRARAGSIRSPLWRGGGVTFGPQNVRNFKKTLSKKARRRAFFQILAEKIRRKQVIVINDFTIEKPKTAKMVASLKKLGAVGRTLILLDAPDTAVNLSSRNIPDVSVRLSRDVNVTDLLSADHVVFTKKAIQVLKDLYENLS